MNFYTHFKQVLFYLLSITIVTIIASSCVNDTTVNNPPNNGTATIMGTVVYMTGVAMYGVEVSIGTNVTYTDSKGEYTLTNVPSGSRILVNFKSQGYVSTQKIAQTISGKTTYITATLSAIGTTQNISASSGGTVSTNGASVNFPVNSFVDSKGTAFSGTVQVQITYFNPANVQFTEAFPGDFSGLRTDGSTTAIESFGFIAVDIYNGADKLQLVSGKEATITIPISAAIISKAPSSIPLWYYDDTQGIWKEEGSAQKTGNNYVGTVKHFSNWNCDMPQSTSHIRGRVVDGSGNPIYMAHVNSEGQDYTGSSRVNTNDSGRFVISVKSSSQASVWANYYIFNSPKVVYNTPATGDTLDIGDIVVNVDMSSLCVIVGEVVDNLGNPVSNVNTHLLDSNGKLVDYILTSTDGKFKFYGGLNTKYTLRINFCTYNDTSKSGYKDTTFVTGSNGGVTLDLGTIKVDRGGAFLTGHILDSLSNPIPNVYIYTDDCSSYGSNERSYLSDSTGAFKLSVRPDKDINITFYNKQISKKLAAHSPGLGQTTDLGNIMFP
jgi:hypothetical protein